MSGEHFEWSVPSYEELRIAELNIQDESLSALLAESLAEQVENIRRGRDRNISRWWGGHGRQIVPVQFNMASGGTRHRNIRISDSRHVRMIQLLANDESFKEIFLNLPENPQDIMLSYRWDSINLPANKIQEVYRTLRVEVSELDFDIWRGSGGVFDFSRSMTAGRHYGEFNVRGFRRSRTFSSTYNITGFTPRTAETLIRLTNEYNFDDIQSALEDIMANNNVLSWSVQLHDISGQQPVRSIGGRPVFDRGAIGYLLDEIRTQDHTDPQFLMQLSMEVGSRGQFERISRSLFFNTDNEEMLDRFWMASYYHW